MSRFRRPVAQMVCSLFMYCRLAKGSFFAGQDNLLGALKRAPRPNDLNAAHDGGCRRLAAICQRVRGIIDVLGADSKPNQEQPVSCPQNKSPLGQTYHRICCSAGLTLHDHFNGFGQQPVEFWVTVWFIPLHIENRNSHLLP
jgi:hypothetical protein